MIWKDIIGIEQKYCVSEVGAVFSKVTNKILKGFIDRYGYLHYRLNSKHYTAHRLVARHFIPCNDLSLHVNHKDGNKLNNNVENLEWVTLQQNTQHKIDVLGYSSKGELNPSVKLTEALVKDIKSDLKNGLTQHVIARKYSISRSTISMININRIWKYIS